MSAPIVQLPLSLFLVASLAFGGVGPQGSVPTPLEELAQKYSQALRIRVVGLAPRPAPTAAVVSAVARVTGATAERLTRVKTYDARHGGRGKKGALRLGLVPIDGAARATHVLVALGDGKRIQAVAALDAEGAPVAKNKQDDEWSRYLSQFGRRIAPALDSARPRTEFAALSRKVLATKNGQGDAKHMLTRALLRQRQLMMHQLQYGGRFAVAFLTGEKPDPADARQVVADFRAIAALRKDLAAFLGEAGDKYAQHAKTVVELFSELADVAAKGKLGGARTYRRRLSRACGSCHTMRGGAFEGRFAPASRSKRKELGIGNGYFLVGHDVLPMLSDGKAAQAVADAVLQAVLLLGVGF